MEEAFEHERRSNGSEAASLKFAHAGGGSTGRGLSQAYALSLDDCLYALQSSIPHLSRSTLHRCLQRHGISRLPDSKFAYAELHERQKRSTTVEFFRRLIEVVPYRIHTVLTDNGIQFTNRKTDRWAFRHLFDRVCLEHGIEHWLTKPNHPWTNGQVERMNRTLRRDGEALSLPDALRATPASGYLLDGVQLCEAP